MFARVIVDISISETDKIFDYIVPQNLLRHDFSLIDPANMPSGKLADRENCANLSNSKARNNPSDSEACDFDSEAFGNPSGNKTCGNYGSKSNCNPDDKTCDGFSDSIACGNSSEYNPGGGEGGEMLKRGQRVLVPFGGRTVEGYVVALSETSDCPPEKLKEITKVLDKIPVISEEMFSLAGFMQKRYNLKLVDTMRLFIPSQMRGGRVKELTRLFARLNPEFVTGDPDAFIKPNALAQRELYDYLLQCGGAFASELNKNFSASALKNLTARGIVLSEPRQIMRSPSLLYSDAAPEFVLTDSQKAAVERITEDISNNIADDYSTSGVLSQSDATTNGVSTKVASLQQTGFTTSQDDNTVEDKSFESQKTSIFLLHGVTGSGKTEVYMNAITAALKKGKSAIMLVPEISLTPQVFARFKSRFGDRVAILHSGLSAGERFDEWTRLLTGEASIAVGARSAIFAPISNVGIIIIDEEHDQSYSSESNPRYITHEVARFRSQYNCCNLVLGSATPSVETYYKSQKGEYRLLEMPSRVGGSTMPEIKTVNMCNEIYSGNSSMFSAELFSRLTDCLNQGNQAMLFINRRGYSSFVRCLACGYVAACERCDVSLVYHKDERALKCHYCGGRYNVPTVCPKCGAEHFRQGYIGTQQVEEKLKEMFPKARTLRMDNDTTQSKDMHADILGRFKDREADILIGTQMIAKGHDFGAVTLVGIMDADVSLHFADYKSCERTFQLITQVAGRAGRADKRGSVVLQTYSPGHYAYRFATSYDYRGFYKKEVNLREVTNFPPFAHIVRILVSAEKEQAAAPVLKTIYDGVRALDAEFKGSFVFLTYMFAPVKRIKDITRMQVLCRITQNFDEILPRIYALVNGTKAGTAKVFVEINPNSLN